MFNVIKRWPRMIPILSLLLLPSFLSCAHAKKIYFNDSDKIQADVKGHGVCSGVGFDCVVMSKGQFRNITGQEVDNGKQFVIVYQ